MKKGNRRGPAYGYNVKALRNQKMAIAEQAERAYVDFVKQWQDRPRSNRPTRCTGAANAAGHDEAARRGVQPQPR